MLAATEDEVAAYPEYAAILENYGYDWEPHEVKTEDGWFLTVFRIKPVENKGKLPLLLVHGAMDSAAGYIVKSSEDRAWALQMVKKGYEVWLNNSRGVKYSNRHERDGEWSLRERWDFTWAEMGYYDIPAVIEYILSVTGAPKVTVAAHS